MRERVESERGGGEGSGFGRKMSKEWEVIRR